MIGYPRGWSASTDGRLLGAPVFLGEASMEELENHDGQLFGKIVLTRPVQTNFA